MVFWAYYTVNLQVDFRAMCCLHWREGYQIPVYTYSIGKKNWVE